MFLKKIISGGQTGVDTGALSSAHALGIQTGGWAPPDMMNEEGLIDKKFGLVPSEKFESENSQNVPRSERTKLNVQNSDATLILVSNDYLKLDQGTEWTKICCLNYQKPFIISGFGEEQVLDWLKKFKPSILNVAGPPESRLPGIQLKTQMFLIDILNVLINEK